ncbi:acyl-CoA synthetase FdrA [Bacillus sp. ISL-40]|uniref:acyl-CoA synthetase FdrA n=1 Tax=unclassified Bacillus (in: firmicutes) TaxID=185979 RepID=UPI001BEB8D76|nr:MULTISPECIES: acyl-CoA synthetase FdrA [unclassified Bacillus (in: firmicutes)]MBT2699898.1 acyl-CoA synthetase FdrA [Bacillus sp. ISL-40]MBT2722917.1 acyl-CoA synthetase FdrA [Bacillus sp. ISL-46]MBT2743797.1 acyl-CoA synthetase FdrA [Bacillus sp. ISL-77]
MTVEAIVKPNTYFDSVSLMSLSTKANQIEGVEQAIIAMGTEMNKEVMRNVGLMTSEVEEAKSNDLIIVVNAATEALCENAFVMIDELFTKKDTSKGKSELKYSTIASAAQSIPEANLAVIAVNGAYATREAKKALENNLHVMLFSDNVSIEDEIELKTLAHEKGLLMMGPDCGTAIIGNVALCFANAVRKGSIGIVGASGTGSQEVSVRIHEFGGGISQMIGTGGRDLKEEIGGIMMLDGIKALEDDEATKVIVLISKPPAPSVEEKVLDQIKRCKKPVVVWFVGGNEEKVIQAGGQFAKMSKEAALKAVLLAGVDESKLNKRALNIPLIEEVRTKLTPDQKYIRGLFSGGTLCDEAMHAAMEKFDNVYSNIQRDPEYRLKDRNKSQAHTFIDFGDDEFTQGKPHPMIDPSTRISRFIQEAKDPSVGVIVMDFVLGYGAHEDPVGAMLPAIIEAKQAAEDEGRHLEIIGYVLGTELDLQNLEEQIDKLLAAGVTHASSSQNAGLLAREFVVKGE